MTAPVEMEFVSAEQPEKAAGPNPLNAVGMTNQLPAPRAISVAGPIADPPDGLEFTPVSDDKTPAFVPPIVAASPFKDGIMKQLNTLPSDQSFDQAVNLNYGDLKWPLMAFKGINPDVAARVDQLAKDNGIPYSAAEAGKEDLEANQQAKQIYDSLSATDNAGNFIYPNTIKWLQSDPANLAKCRDDLDTLTAIEHAVKLDQQGGEGTFKQTLRSVGSGFLSSLADLYRTPGIAAGGAWTEAGHLASTGFPGFPTLNNLLANNLENASTDDVPDWLSTWFGYSRALDKEANAIAPGSLEGDSFAGALSRGDYAAAAKQGVAGAAQFIPLIAASAVDPALGLGYGAGSSAGGQFKADIENGKTPDQATQDAFLNAGVNTVGLKSFGTVAQFERARLAFAKPVGQETATQLWGRIAKRGITSAFQGGATQAAIQAGDDLADNATGNKNAFNNEGSKIAAAAILGFVADGAIAVPSGAIEGLRQIKAQQDGQDAWSRVTGAARDSKLSRRDPDALADNITQNLVAAGKPTTVGIDADKLTTFFQDRPDAELNKFAQDMSLAPDDIKKAAVTGGTLDLPIGPYQAKYAGKSDLDTAIQKDLRFAPGGLSANELQDQITHVQQLSESIKEELAKTATGEANELPYQIREMRDRLMADKSEGGAGFTADQADSQLAVLLAGLKHSVALPGEPLSNVVNRLGLNLKTGGEAPADNPNARGAIEFGDGTTTIHLFKSADFSTFAHETGHLFLNQRQKMIDAGTASPQAVADHQALLAHVGVKPGEKPTTEETEKLVSNFESYLREGKAPSVELSGPFARFRSWLTSIYRSIIALGTQPTDEVRAIFDRMLASEDDIAHAQEYYSRKGDVLNLIKADEAGKQDARAKLAKVQQSELDKQTSAYLKSYLKAIGGRSAIREAAEKAVNGSPVYQALNAAKDGKINEESLRAALGSKGLSEFEAKFPNLVKSDGYHTLESLAAELGFDTPQSLADNLIAAVPKAEAISNYTSRLVAEKEQQLREEIIKRGATPADGVMHSEASLAYLIAEAQLMARQLGKGRAVRIDAAAYRDAAREVLTTLSVKKAIRQSDFAKTEARLARQVLDLARRGQWEDITGADGQVVPGALTMRRKQIAQHAMVQESIKARDLVSDIVDRYKPTKLEVRLKNVENQYVAPVREILSRYGLSDVQNSTRFDLHQIEGLDATLFSQIPSWIIDGEHALRAGDDYRSLTYGQLQDVDNAARSLIEFGNDALKSNIAADEKTVGALVEESVAAISALRDRNRRQLGGTGAANAAADKWAKAVKAVDWVGSHFTKFQFAARRLDNFSELRGEATGVVTRIWNAMRDGEKHQGDAQSAFYELAKPHLETLANATKRLRAEFGNRFAVDGVEKPLAYAEDGELNWSPEELVAYLMNTGAEGNIAALKNSFGHDTIQFDRVARLFSTKELKALDGIRKALDSLFDGLDETNFKLYNRHVEKVAAVPQDLTDNEGNPVHLDGGYWPLVFDRRVNDRRGLGDGSDADVLNDQTRAMIRAAKPQDGFTKSRVVGHSLSPRLDMGLLGDHVDNTTRFTHLAPVIRDANRLMTNPIWRSAAVDKMGEAEYKQMLEWLRYQANPSRKATDDLNGGIEQWIARARTLGTKSAMGLNLLSFLKWRSALFNGSAELGGWKWVMRGYGDAGLKGLSTSTLGLTSNDLWREMVSKSNVLGPRESHGVRDLRQDVEKLKWDAASWTIPGTNKQVTGADLKHLLYAAAQAGDRAVVFPVWRGAYIKFMETIATPEMTDAERETAAIAYADNVIHASQPTSLNVDLSSLHRDGRELVKLLSMFTTYPVTLSNRLREHYEAYRNGAISFPQFANKLTQEGIFEPLSRALITAAWYGTVPTAAALAFAPLTNVVETAPVISSVVTALWEGDPNELSPALDIFKLEENLRKDWKSGKGAPQLAWDVARLIGYAKGVPLANVAKPLLRWIAQANGEKSELK